MDGLEVARNILNKEKVLFAFYRELNAQVERREAIKIANQLKDLQDEQVELLTDLISDLDALKVNQELPLQRKLAQYVVQRGDTLFIIAQKYNTSVDNLLKVNPEIEDPDKIQTEMVINLPIVLPSPPESFEEYTVQAGDSLFKIAQKFNTTVPALVFHNNILNPDFIFPGRILIIP